MDGYRFRCEGDSHFHCEADCRRGWVAECIVPQLHVPELHRVLRTELAERSLLREACRGLRTPETLGSHVQPANAAAVWMRVVCASHGTPPLLEEWAAG